MFEIGDVVKVVKRVDRWTINNVNTAWANQMDKTINEVGIIIDKTDSGYKIKTEVLTNYWYPEESLELYVKSNDLTEKVEVRRSNNSENGWLIRKINKDPHKRNTEAYVFMTIDGEWSTKISKVNTIDRDPNGATYFETEHEALDHLRNFYTIQDI